MWYGYVIIIVGNTKIGRHDRYKIASVLIAVCFTHFNTRNFSDGVGFVGWLQFTGQQIIFFQWLGSEFWINTGRSQEHEFFYPGLVGSVYYITLDHNIVVQEFA